MRQPQAVNGVDERLTMIEYIVMVVVTAVTSAGYLYMTLKMGLTPSMSIVTCLTAYFFLGQMKNFTAKKNNLVQACASSGTSTAFMCVVVAALDMMGFSTNPYLVFLWLLCTCSIGVLMAVPMRKQYIEVEKLRFADGVATAETLKVLEDPTGPGVKKTVTLAGAGMVAMAFTWIRDVVAVIPGALFGNAYMLGMESSLMLVGSGALVGIRVCFWMLVTSLLTWGVLAPHLVETGVALEVAKIFKMEDIFEKQAYYSVLMRWTMWPATVLLVSAGLTALAVRWRLVLDSFKSFARAATSGSAHDEFSFKTVTVGVGALTVVLCVIQYVGFGINPFMTVLGVGLSFPLMLVGIRAAGETNVGPVSVMGSMMQMVFSWIAPGNMAANMTTSGTCGSIAASSQDVMFDLKAGSILGSSPKKLTVVQFIGIPIGAAVVAIVQPILKAAYGYGGEKGLPAPTAFKWKGFAELLNGGAHLPKSVIIAVVIAAVAGVILSLCEKRWAKWTPSAMGIGIAMLLPSQMVVIMGLGGVLWWIWERCGKTSSGLYAIPVASGLVAGEAIMAVVIPVLTILGVLG